MSRRERRRLEHMSRVRDGEMTLAKAAGLMAISYRQAKRVYKRYRDEGDTGLVHRLRGRRSNRAHDRSTRERIVELYAAKYLRHGPTQAAEYMLEEDGQVVCHETLRLWLIEAGLWSKRKSKSKPTHRQWRPRKEHCGEMVQMDGSEHDWFLGRGERCVLMVMIDDATSRTYARFFKAETTAAAFEMLHRYADLYGLPQSLYVDKDSIYKTTRDASVDEQVAEQAPLTQFGRAMQDLCVRLILAHSPQAKGRVERRNGVFQDRLVKLLERRGINDRETANELLESEFLPKLNTLFCQAPAKPADLHRAVADDVDLDRVLAFQDTRQVGNDWTVRWHNRWFQLAASDVSHSLVGRRILVCQHLDGTLRFQYRGTELAWHELPERPARPQPEPVAKSVRQPYKPAPDHPWRRRMLPVRASRRSGASG